MISKRYSTLQGLTVPVNIYESSDEADKAAGKVGACADECNNNLVYRGVLPQVRDYVVQLVKEVTGIEPKGKPVIDEKTGKPEVDAQGNPVIEVTESDGKYVARVCAEKNWENLAALQPQIDAWATGQRKAKDGSVTQVAPLAVDITVKERTSTPKAVPEVYLNAAKNLIAKGQATLDKLAQKLQNESNTPLNIAGLDGDALLQAVGKAIQANELAKRRAEEQKRAAEYGNL